MEEANRDRLDASRNQVADHFTRLAFVERLKHRAIHQDALFNPNPKTPLDQWLGFGQLQVKNVVTNSVAISMESRKPFVVSKPVLTPFRSMSAFVTSVVPWMMLFRSACRIPADAKTLASSGNHCLRGLSRSGECLPKNRRPSESIRTMSVKVPPMSTPTETSTLTLPYSETII